VLDEVRDAWPVVALVPRAARQPDTKADRPHVRNGLGQQAQTVIEDVADNHRYAFGWIGGWD
jgi:hypothetical protein